ncbi:hypothetical protein GCM10022419_126860 [Nonomuraea rosea]|uniref:Uncharacterized protein n=1 Tax=Nonomuraea rosea TaxID=638574 RepID=A0ABP6ZV04_9ACTN
MTLVRGPVGAVRHCKEGGLASSVNGCCGPNGTDRANSKILIREAPNDHVVGEGLPRPSHHRAAYAGHAELRGRAMTERRYPAHVKDAIRGILPCHAAPAG